MKTRNGFVSNSSSSSFIIMGVPLSEEIENILNVSFPKKQDEEDYDWYDRIARETGLAVLYIEQKEMPHIIGKVLADVGRDGEYLENQNYSMSDLSIMAGKVIHILGCKDIDVKLMMGTRPC